MGTESLQQTPAFGMVSEPRDQVTSLQTIILKVPGTERITRVYLSSLCIDMGQCRQHGWCGRQAPVSVGPTGEQPSALSLALAYGHVPCTLIICGPQTPSESPSPTPTSVSSVGLSFTIRDGFHFLLLSQAGSRHRETHTAISSFSVAVLLDFSSLPSYMCVCGGGSAFSWQLNSGLIPLGGIWGGAPPLPSL